MTVLHLLFHPPPLLLYTYLLMCVLPYNIFYMLRLFPVLESEGLDWVLESLGIRLVSLVVTQDGLSLPVSVWNRTHNGGWQEYSRAWRLWFWVYKCSSQWFGMPCVSVNMEDVATDFVTSAWRACWGKGVSLFVKQSSLPESWMMMLTGWFTF